MNERIKKIRTEMGSKMSQQKFADFLGVSFSNIQAYEYGKRSPSDAFIKLICNKCNINEEWLRTGSGEMYLPQERHKQIADLVNNLLDDDDDFKRRLIEEIARLDKDQIAFLKDFAKRITKGQE